MKQPGAYFIPDDWETSELACIQVYIPKHTYWLGCFWRAYQYFTQWVAYERDEAHTAKDVAAMWRVGYLIARAQWEALEGCTDNMDVRQNSEVPCELDKTPDGVTWTQFANLQLCPPQISMPTTPGNKPSWWNPAANGGDGGWETLPLPATPEPYDPAFDDPQTPFPPDWVAEGSDGRCVAAANVTASLQSVFERVDYGLFIGNVVTVVWTEVVIFIYGIRVLGKKLVDLLRAIANIANSFEYSVWHPDYEGFDWDNLTQELACFFNEDGTVAVNTFSVRRAGIEHYSGPVWTLIKGILDIGGPNSLNNAKDFAGITTFADECGDCPDVFDHIFDLNDEDGGFVQRETGLYSEWEDGIGWKATDYLNERLVGIKRTFEARTVTLIDFNADVELGTMDNTNLRAIQGSFEGSVVFTQFYPNAADTNLATQWAGSEELDEIVFLCYCWDNAGGPHTGHVHVFFAEVAGVGIDPF